MGSIADVRRLYARRDAQECYARRIGFGMALFVRAVAGLEAELRREGKAEAAHVWRFVEQEAEEDFDVSRLADLTRAARLGGEVQLQRHRTCERAGSHGQRAQQASLPVQQQPDWVRLARLKRERAEMQRALNAKDAAIAALEEQMHAKAARTAGPEAGASASLPGDEDDGASESGGGTRAAAPVCAPARAPKRPRDEEAPQRQLRQR
jgi:hypothetical protein